MTVPHTRGPWAVSKNSTGRRVTSATGVVICNAVLRNQGGPKHKAYLKYVEEAEANAHLIAAAPDLLNELEVREGDLVMLIKAIEAGDPKVELLVRSGDMLRETRAAIAKAGSA